MNTRSLFAAIALTVAATGTWADDITVAHERFEPMTSRAAVTAQVQQARGTGVHSFVTEAGATAVTPAMPVVQASPLTREQVRAEVRAAPRAKVGAYNWAA